MAPTKYIDIFYTGPPTADMGAFFAIIDDEGNQLDIGEWVHNGAFWGLRIPTELVKRIVVGERPEETQRPAVASYTPNAMPAISMAREARRALKERIASAPKKPAPAAPSAALPADWIKCPSCDQPFDPKTGDELMACGTCGEDRSTACCLKDPTQPCADCRALKVGPEEGGFDLAASPGGERLFDDKFHGKSAPGQDAEEALDSIEEDE